MNFSTEFKPIYFPDCKSHVNQQMEKPLFYAKQRVLGDLFSVEQAEKNAALCPKRIIRHCAAL